MKKYSIFGNPVEHSISPLIHNAAFKGLGIDAEYTKILLENGDELKNRFLREDLSGANITVPHKEYAYAACDEVDSFAKKIRAVNTIVKKNGKLHGYNTDAPGFLKTIENYKNLIHKVLILGAGGTAKAISNVLKLNNYDVTILNRSEYRLKQFKKDKFNCYAFNEIPKIENQQFELIINTTSAGLNNNNFPAPENLLNKLIEKSIICIDVIYGEETPFLKLAKKHEKPTKDGIEMLLQQGVIAFMHFTDDQYDYSLIESYMREAIKKYNPTEAHIYDLSAQRKELISDIFIHRKILKDKKSTTNEILSLASQYDKIGDIYLKGGYNYLKAQFYFEKSLNIRQELFNKDNSIDLSTNYFNLAILSRLQGHYKKSEEYYQKTLSIFQAQNKPDDTKVKYIKSQLGILYQDMGNLKKSNSYINEISDTTEDQYTQAINYNNLAALKNSEGQYIEAIELYDKALKIQKTLGNKIHIASIYDNLGYVYKSLGSYDKALELYQKSLIMRIDTIGKEHEDTAFTYYNLATTLMNLKKFDEAEKYYMEALEIRNNIYGTSMHPKIASLYESIGILSLLKSTSCRDSDKNKLLLKEKGKDSLLKSIKIRLETLGEEHPDTASGYFTLGSYFYKYENNLDEGLNYYTKSLHIRQKVFNSDKHPDIATNYYHISLIYLAKKECLSALKYGEKALDITKELNYTHPLKHNFSTHLKTITYNIKKAKKATIKKRTNFCTDL